MSRLFYFQAVILFATATSPRLEWVAQWLGMRLVGKGLQVCCDADQLPTETAVINYSNRQLAVANYQIVPNGLLHAEGIAAPTINMQSYKGMPVFFATTGGHHVFDILAASFFLLSRYEEYYPNYELDEYNRYSHQNCVAFQHGFLHRPIVDEWIEDLKTSLRGKFPSQVLSPNEFRFVPSYDVDVAFGIQHKGWLRNGGGFFKELKSGNWRQAVLRCKVWMGLSPDPLDIFEELQQLHSGLQLQPVYFFLIAKKYKGYDKNIDRANSAYRQLMRKLNTQSTTGLHASWAASNNEVLLKDEKVWMDALLNSTVVRNRMHYINFRLPDTFRQLLALGISEEYSMGYGTVNGFRAGTAHPYYWYDLAAEASTPLQIFPYAWMDANSIFEHKHTTEQALAQLQSLHDAVRTTGGVFITIAHNHLMGKDETGRNWWKIYSQFLQRNFE
ncbi:MAG TPA: polysaccharide deacetylase family protein [Phnomibacter sp.]|nr:polysaccharide deacetylase family protein [Phnomibacter sp.]